MEIRSALQGRIRQRSSNFIFTGSKEMWTGRNVRLVVFAWGKSYVDRLLEHAVAAALSPGNLPALAKRFDCTVVVVTEESLFDYVRSHPIGQQVQAICALKLVSLDNLIAEPWQYGISIAYALFEGIRDLGELMTDTYLLFLNADFVLADGSYERLIPYMLEGHRAILSPSYCVNEEEVAPLLSDRANDDDGIIKVAPREMAKLIIANRHNTILAKTVNQSTVHFKYADQFYWLVDEQTILGHQMPIALVAMRPEKCVEDLGTFWDWGVVYEFCPSKELTVLGDSDEFLMLELRPRGTHLDLLLPGAGTPTEKASAMSVYITQYQLDNAVFPLTLHAQDLPGGIEEARTALANATNEVLRAVTSVPDHKAHAQWIYHQQHLQYYLETRPQRTRIALLKKEISSLEERIGLAQLASFAAELDNLKSKLQAGQEAITARFGPTLKVPMGWRMALGTAISSFNRAMFGSVPSVNRLSILWPLFRRFWTAAKRLNINKADRVLVVADSGGDLLWQFEGIFSSSAVRVAPVELLESSANDDSPFELCVMQLQIKNLVQFESLCHAAKNRMSPTGKILISFVDVSSREPYWVLNLAARTRLFAKDAEIYVGGRTFLIEIPLLAIAVIRRFLPNGRRKEALIVLVMLISVPLALLSNFVESISARESPLKPSRYGRSLTAIVSV